MSDSTNKPGAIYWVISVLALVWNSFGVLAYLGNAYMSDDAFALLDPNMQTYQENQPAWFTACFAIAVFSAFIASIGLLTRKKWANPLFVLGFLAMIPNFIYDFFVQSDIVIEGSLLYMSFAILLIAIFLVWFSKKSVSDGTLR